MVAVNFATGRQRFGAAFKWQVKQFYSLYIVW